MTRTLAVGCAVVCVVLLVGCGRTPAGNTAPAESKAPVETGAPEVASVDFDLQAQTAKDGAQKWSCSYASQGKTARFRIDLGPSEAARRRGPDGSEVQSGEGTILPEANSDSTALVAALDQAMGAKTRHAPAPNKTSVPFTYANIGENLSLTKDGAFSKAPAGDWRGLQMIVGDENHEAQFLLYVNVKSGKGQFVRQDSKYGDAVVGELAHAL